MLSGEETEKTIFLKSESKGWLVQQQSLLAFLASRGSPSLFSQRINRLEEILFWSVDVVWTILPLGPEGGLIFSTFWESWLLGVVWEPVLEAPTSHSSLLEHFWTQLDAMKLSCWHDLYPSFLISDYNPQYNLLITLGTPPIPNTGWGVGRCALVVISESGYSISACHR